MVERKIEIFNFNLKNERIIFIFIKIKLPNRYIRKLENFRKEIFKNVSFLYFYIECGERRRRNVKIRIHYPWKMKGVRNTRDTRYTYIYTHTYIYTKRINSIDLNDRLARTLHDNNHEVINSGNRFCIFFFFFFSFPFFPFFFFFFFSPVCCR